MNLRNEQRKKTHWKRYEQSLRDVLRKNKRSMICIIRVPEERRGSEIERILEEVMVENEPFLTKSLEIPEAEQPPNRTTPPPKSKPRHITIKFLKAKDNILKATREKWHVIYTEIAIQMTANFSSFKTVEDTSKWHNILKCLMRRTAYCKFCIQGH